MAAARPAATRASTSQNAYSTSASTSASPSDSPSFNPSRHSSATSLSDLDVKDKTDGASPKLLNTYGEEFKLPNYAIKDIFDAIPKHCYQRSALRSLGYVLRDLVLLTVTFVAFNNHIIPAMPNVYARGVAWAVYSVLQGLFGTGLWVLAHECGHGAFSDYKLLNNTVGFILHSSLLVPYFSWQISHHKHHKATGHMQRDMVFVPRTRAEYALKFGAKVSELMEETPIFTALHMIGQQLIGWPLYLVTNTTGHNFHERQSEGRGKGKKNGWFSGVNHFNQESPLYENKHRNLILLSDVGLITMGYVLYAACQRWGAATVMLWYGVPYLWVNHWLVAITYLQHTDPTLPHYDSSAWNFTRGAAATIDRDFGFIGRHLLHGIIETHVAHHYVSSIPFYNADEVTEAIKGVMGEHYRSNTEGGMWGFLAAMWHSARWCHFVEESKDAKGSGVLFFRNRNGLGVPPLEEPAVKKEIIIGGDESVRPWYILLTAATFPLSEKYTSCPKTLGRLRCATCQLTAVAPSWKALPLIPPAAVNRRLNRAPFAADTAAFARSPLSPVDRSSATLHPAFTFLGFLRASNLALVEMLKRKRPASETTKFYAVRTGFTPGIYKTYADCLAQVTGFKKAEFKSFTSQSEAEQYLSGKDPSTDPSSPSYVPKFYGVRSGGIPGVYTSWEECQKHVVGVKNPKFRHFSTREEAEAFVRGVGEHSGLADSSIHNAGGSGGGASASAASSSAAADSREDEDSRNTRRKTSATGSRRGSTAIDSILDGDDLNADLREAGLLDDGGKEQSEVLDDNILEDVEMEASGNAVKRSSPKLMRSVLVPKKTAVLKIYTDGSSLMNGSASARAGVGIWFGPGDKRNLSEPLNDPKATNNRAELSAILRAIEIAPKHREVLIFTDSKYAIQCVTEWFQKWRANGWHTAAGRSVENQDLIEDILQRIEERVTQGGAKTKFEWVNGHKGVVGNEMADKLARDGAVRDGSRDS
ncbi:hypothetical protein DRE_07652 [Drechslerella stenobrocha 248]|uniref:Ribonuclease H n=1 Tax=Drechslerella stenobrocha 248 TaxID=1043628 RepID=W7I3V0_9PEZI|nr:hypothetical protein DRE_07652 [Drechslerella stenobrocha 248]